QQAGGSGGAMLLRRETLERLGGWDDGFFLYCEDIDTCRRVHDLGLEVLYEPESRVVHAGGQSAPWSSTLPILAASRLRYARLHRSRAAGASERVGIALEAATHWLLRRGRPAPGPGGGGGGGGGGGRAGGGGAGGRGAGWGGGGGGPAGGRWEAPPSCRRPFPRRSAAPACSGTRSSRATCRSSATG